MKGVLSYFRLRPLSEILTIVNLRHAASRIWTYAEPEFRLCWMKLCSRDNYDTTAPQLIFRMFLYYSLFPLTNYILLILIKVIFWYMIIYSFSIIMRSLPSWISDTPLAGFEPMQNLSSGFVEWSCAVEITTTPRRHNWFSGCSFTTAWFHWRTIFC